MRLSKSKINTYLKCPREFKYRYIDEIEMPPNEYMALGSDVHKVAEDYVVRYGDKPQMDIRYSLDLIAESLNLDSDEIDVHLDSLASFFRRAFVENDYKLFSQEEYLTDETHNITGITDIVLENPEGDLIVIDYKTGSSSSFSKCRRELGYYKMLVENNYEDRTVVAAGIFFTKNNKLRLLHFEENPNKRKFMMREELEEGLDILYEVREKVNQEKFPKNEQYVCRFCTYADICFKDYD